VTGECIVSFSIWQWDPKSPWHDERVRRATSLAIDRKGVDQAITLGYSKITGRDIVAQRLSPG